MTAAPSVIPQDDTVPNSRLDELYAMLPDVAAAEDRMDGQARLWQAVMRVVPMAIVVADDVEVRETSRAFDRLLGYEAGELAGKSWVALVHPDDRREAMEAASSASIHGGVRFVARCRMRDGRYRVLDWHQWPVPDDDATISVIRDGGESGRDR